MQDHGTPFLAHDPYDWPALLGLIQRAFAYMEGRIDPPSSLYALTPQGLAVAGETWVLGRPAVACMVLKRQAAGLYLGKLAVDPGMQGQGLGRLMVARAEDRARELGLSVVELETRIELEGNHKFYLGLGYREISRSAHPGFDRPTSVRYGKQV